MGTQTPISQNVENATRLGELTDKQLRSIDAVIDWRAEDTSQIDAAQRHGVAPSQVSKYDQYAPEHLIEERRQTKANEGISRRNGELQTTGTSDVFEADETGELPLTETQVETAIELYVRENVFNTEVKVEDIHYSGDKVLVDFVLGGGD